MSFSLTFLDADFNALVAHLFVDRERERAAYLLCSRSSAESDNRLLVRHVRLIPDSAVLSASKIHVQIPSRVSVAIFKEADEKDLSIVFVHSHPEGFHEFSPQDDSEEEIHYRSMYIRAPRGPHASVVFSAPDRMSARVWLENGVHLPVTKVRVIGERFRFFSKGMETLPPVAFDRQVRAFGLELQKVLADLHVGVVGAGGIGSAVIEQLIRLGVGEISVFDHDQLAITNVNRVLGSAVNDAWRAKVDIAKRNAERIGLGTKVNAIESAIADRTAALKLRSCDVIFGCTDDHYGRAILNRIAIAYFIPVLDCAVRIDSENGKIRSVVGRVTTLRPGRRCLRCRHRISAAQISAEAIAFEDPEEYRRLRKLGYVEELGGIAPAVVTFTMPIASFAVNELLNRITQFSGETSSDEVLVFFDEMEIRRNSLDGLPDCICGVPAKWGRGDTPLFLGITWTHRKPSEPGCPR